MLKSPQFGETEGGQLTSTVRVGMTAAEQDSVGSLILGSGKVFSPTKFIKGYKSLIQWYAM